jgi:hypothetical protein
MATSIPSIDGRGLSYLLPTSLAVGSIRSPAFPPWARRSRSSGASDTVPAAQPDPFVALGLQILFIQVLACPAVALVWDSSPEYVLVAFAAIVGAHFLPFEWLYRTGLYRFLGVVIAVGPYILAILFRERALHYTGFFVGSVMMLGAFGARSYAAATWRAHHALTASPDVVPATGRRIR